MTQSRVSSEFSKFQSNFMKYKKNQIKTQEKVISSEPSWITTWENEITKIMNKKNYNELSFDKQVEQMYNSRHKPKWISKKIIARQIITFTDPIVKTDQWLIDTQKKSKYKLKKLKNIEKKYKNINSTDLLDYELQELFYMNFEKITPEIKKSEEYTKAMENLIRLYEIDTDMNEKQLLLSYTRLNVTLNDNKIHQVYYSSDDVVQGKPTDDAKGFIVNGKFIDGRLKIQDVDIFNLYYKFKKDKKIIDTLPEKKSFNTIYNKNSPRPTLVETIKYIKNILKTNKIEELKEADLEFLQLYRSIFEHILLKNSKYEYDMLNKYGIRILTKNKIYMMKLNPTINLDDGTFSVDILSKIRNEIQVKNIDDLSNSEVLFIEYYIDMFTEMKNIIKIKRQIIKTGKTQYIAPQPTQRIKPKKNTTVSPYISKNTVEVSIDDLKFLKKYLGVYLKPKNESEAKKKRKKQRYSMIIQNDNELDVLNHIFGIGEYKAKKDSKGNLYPFYENAKTVDILRNTQGIYYESIKKILLSDLPVYQLIKQQLSKILFSEDPDDKQMQTKLNDIMMGTNMVRYYLDPTGQIYNGKGEYVAHIEQPNAVYQAYGVPKKWTREELNEKEYNAMKKQENISYDKLKEKLLTEQRDPTKDEGEYIKWVEDHYNIDYTHYNNLKIFLFSTDKIAYNKLILQYSKRDQDLNETQLSIDVGDELNEGVEYLREIGEQELDDYEGGESGDEKNEDDEQSGYETESGGENGGESGGESGGENGGENGGDSGGDSGGGEDFF